MAAGGRAVATSAVPHRRSARDRPTRRRTTPGRSAWCSSVPGVARTVPDGDKPAAAVSSAPANDAPRTGKRASPNILGDAADWVGDRIDDVENWAEDNIEGLASSPRWLRA